MSNYWKKKLEELEKSTSKSSTSSTKSSSSNNSSSSTKSSNTSSNYWQNKLNELEKEEKKKKSEDIAPVKTSDDEYRFATREEMVDRFKNEWSLAGNTAMAGLNAFNKLLTGTADLILGKPLRTAPDGSAFDTIGKWIGNVNEYYQGTYDQYKAEVAESKEALGGGVWRDIEANLIEGTVAAVPNALLAIMTAGASTTATSADLARQATMATGNLLTKVGLTIEGMMKNPQFWTSFAQTYGNDYEEAKANGADDATAILTATLTSLLNAGVEIGFDGMSGIQGLPNKLMDGSEKSVKKAVAEWAESAIEEGGEEVIQGIISDIIARVSYDEDRKIGDLKEMGTNFAYGTAIGGILGGSQVAVQKAINFTQTQDAPKLTENEQKVVDKVVEDRIAEAEKDGKKLTDEEKKVITNEVAEALEKGDISIDTIEEVLGGETYTNYKSALDEEAALKDEHDFLEEIEPDERTVEQTARLAELKQKLEEIKSNSTSAQLKTQLDNELDNLVKDSILDRSYEKIRAEQDYTPDMTKYSNLKHQDAVQKTIQSAKELRTKNTKANNTRAFRNFVDFVTNIAGKTGVPVYLKSGEQTTQEFIERQTARIKEFESLEELTTEQSQELAELKDTLQKVESGKLKVNGVKASEGIVINVDSEKVLNRIVGHELTHEFESAKHYDNLKKRLFAYAKSKGVDIEAEIESRRLTYKGVENSDPEAELVADLVGDYIFNDPDFINNLYVEDRNAFQKMWDEIKHLYKLATAGSKEARELERVKNAFEKVWREGAKANTEAQKNTATESDEVKYLISNNVVDVNGNEYTNVVKLEYDVFNKVRRNGKAYVDYIRNNLIKEKITVFDNNGNMETVEFAGEKERVQKDGAKNSHPVIGELTQAKNELKKLVILNSVETAEISEFANHSEENSHKWLDENGWDERTSYVMTSDNMIYPVTLYIAKTRDGRNILYDVNVKIKEGVATDKNATSALAKKQVQQAVRVTTPSNEGILTQEKSDVNRKYSLSDSDGKQLTKEQQEYFKDSKVRDENGNLKVMYHGSQNAGFHTFDAKMSDDDTSFFFVDRNDVAASYSGTTETYEAQTIKTAEDMNNFLAKIGYDSYKAVETDGKFELLEDNEHVAYSDTAQGLYEEFCWYEGVGEGDANYKVYLNLTNPLVVDGGGRYWNAINFETPNEIVRFEVQNVKGRWKIKDNLNGDYLEIDRAVAWHTEEYAQEALDDYIKKHPKANAVVKTVLNKTRDIAKYAKDNGYDGVIFKDIVDVGKYSNGDEGAATVAVAFDSNQIKSVANGQPTSDADIRYSLSESKTDKNYLDAVNRGDTETAQKMVDEVAKEAGYTVRAYHGTRRGDRVGNVFLPERATSGPMAFFTDNKEIAENYARDKNDTSIAYDHDFDQYETQFRIKTAYSKQDVPLYLAWRILPLDARNRITQNAGRLRENWDGDNELILDPDTNEANGGFQWQLEEARGNAIKALIEQWLNSGTLYNEEARFLEVLEMAGVTEEFKKIGMDSLYFKDPDAKHEKVYDTFLKITNPFDTTTVNEQFVAELEDWYENQDQDKYVRENMASDLWDKNGIDAYEFAERLRRDLENGTSHAWTSIPDSVTDYLKELGYDGIKDAGGKNGGVGHTVWIPFSSEQVKSAEAITYDDNGNVIPLSERFSEDNNDIRYSLSNEGETLFSPITDKDIFGKDILKQNQTEQIAPVKPVAEETTADEFDDYYAPVAEEEANAISRENLASLTDADAPVEVETEYDDLADTTALDDKTLKSIASRLKDVLHLKPKQAEAIQDVVQQYSVSEFPSKEDLYYEIESKFGEIEYSERNDEIAAVKNRLRKTRIRVSEAIKNDIADYNDFKKKHFGKIRFSNDGLGVDSAYMELSSAYPGYFPDDIINPSDQLQRMAEVADMNINEQYEYTLDEDTIQEAVDIITSEVNNYKQSAAQLEAEKNAKGLLDDYAPKIAKEAKAENSTPAEAKTTEEVELTTRQKLHKKIIDNIKAKFGKKGKDLDNVLKNAKNLSTFATVDNTPQRVMEKALGYEAGQILADETVNKVAQNETEGIKWLNAFTNRKNGLLAQLSKEYNIKAGSKESAAAQMYAEGFYVDEKNNIIEYGNAELAKDFPNSKVRNNIKKLASDPRIRQVYDETLAAINESRRRNGYPEIQRLDNYFLHFRAMEDTFSKLGLPFNPNDIRAKDLPTDLNGVTADLKPGQPYFASAMHRTGRRTSFDLLGGLERYLTSAKNQIYHIDDIQTFRALRNYIADTYGQANGLEGLDALSESEQQERIEKVYNSHLSTFAKFLNEEANVLAGKTSLIDRGIEGIIGRRGITFIDNVNKQVGSNMVGLNVSSSLTNFLAGVQAIAKTNKLACIKSLAQTTSSKIGSIFGKTDSFVENNPTIIRRKGADRFYRTPYQKVGDAGYVLMSAVDDVTTEFIVRAKYNEFISKGMSEDQAITEADKWTSRLMGDRSLGQMPLLYNSKMLGLVTKFQLEVRNQLDSQFYDTIQEAKASNKDIENGLARNAKTAAKVTATLFELAVLQHAFGKAFESIAGYNPAFDIISVLATALGFDDDDESEDTALDNIEQGFLELLGDLPYTSTLTGGRIPISSALPVTELIKGVDQYGNEKSRWKTLSEIAPYYVLPTGYGQAKKTLSGLSMFNTDEEHPVAGSYTDSGSLRFPVDDTLGNRIQAGLFGQWANENAREYFDNDYAPLKEKQIQEYVDVDLPIADYWKYREGLKGLETLNEQGDYIGGLDLTVEQKNVLINNLTDRKTPIDFTGYENYANFEEFDFAQRYPEKYEVLKEQGVSVAEYKNNYEETAFMYTDDFSWAANNPEKYTLSKAVTNDVKQYKQITSELYDIKADKDSSGKSISGSRKEKVITYINNLDLDYGAKIILFKSEYPSDDTYNRDIVEYLNGRADISYTDMETILKELGFTVDSKGNISW